MQPYCSTNHPGRYRSLEIRESFELGCARDWSRFVRALESSVHCSCALGLHNTTLYENTFFSTGCGMEVTLVFITNKVYCATL